MKAILRLLGALVALMFCLSAAAGEVLYLGVQDYNRSPILVVRDYQGLANYLGRVLNRTVRVESVKNYDDFIKLAQQKRFTFMYGPPSMIMHAHKVAGYEPVAKIPGLLSAAFMSLSSSGIAFPEDMKGKRIGFTDRDSMITQLALAQLSASHIDPGKYFQSVTYYRDVDGVISALKYHLIDVGVANSGLFNYWTSKGYDINLVLQGKGVPHLTFAVRGDLTPAMKEEITQALLKANQDKDGQEFFQNSGFPSFERARLGDYDELVKYLHI